MGRGGAAVVTSHIQERFITPHVLVAGGDEKPGSWRQFEERGQDWVSVPEVAFVQRHEEVVTLLKIARPDVPARRLGGGWVTQPVDRPLPSVCQQGSRDAELAVLHHWFSIPDSRFVANSRQVDRGRSVRRRHWLGNVHLGPRWPRWLLYFTAVEPRGLSSHIPRSLRSVVICPGLRSSYWPLENDRELGPTATTRLAEMTLCANSAGTGDCGNPGHV
jgi:hypothetical protein